MFSMPAPISAPTDLSRATKHKSETATTPFPTHLSVTTPPASRMVGDWGFKRPLPLKTTTKSTLPLVRVKKVDSIEHVTDFKSASDHTVTLLKWQEMNLNITVPQERGDSKNAKSVFEEYGDVTALSAEELVKTEGVRWKFRGPWLAGMTDGEFNEFLTKNVRGKRAGFRNYLKELCATKMAEDQSIAALDAGEAAPAPILASDITEQDLTEYLRKLRNDRTQLYRVVSRFLDLAPLSVGSTYLQNLKHLMPEKTYHFYADSPYAAKGPPITHPSAGLSYLRTKSYLDNHPVYGPQEHHPPVKARIVMPKNSAPGYNTRIGVAGFITGIPEGETSFNIRNASEARGNKSVIPGLTDYDPDATGGSKVYVAVRNATVDSKGKVLLNLEQANPSAEVVNKELVGEALVFEKAAKEKNQPNYRLERPRMRLRKSSRPVGSSQSYGLGMSSFGRDQ